MNNLYSFEKTLNTNKKKFCFWGYYNRIYWVNGNPRNRTRTTEKEQCSLDKLQAALKLIEEGTSIHRAATQTGIPYSTLQKKFKTLQKATVNSSLRD